MLLHIFASHFSQIKDIYGTFLQKNLQKIYKKLGFVYFKNNKTNIYGIVGKSHFEYMKVLY
jgi:hypothetical protein